MARKSSRETEGGDERKKRNEGVKRELVRH